MRKTFTITREMVTTRGGAWFACSAWQGWVVRFCPVVLTNDRDEMAGLLASFGPLPSSPMFTRSAEEIGDWLRFGASFSGAPTTRARLTDAVMAMDPWSGAVGYGAVLPIGAWEYPHDVENMGVLVDLIVAIVEEIGVRDRPVRRASPTRKRAKPAAKRPRARP